MVKVIMGSRGTGKTKKMIDMVNTAVTDEPGNVVCIEKGQRLRGNINFSAKLIDLSDYAVNFNYDTLFAYICGIYSGNYDITHIFIDSLYKIVDCDCANEAGVFLNKLEEFSKVSGIKFTIMISADVATATDEISKFF